MYFYLILISVVVNKLWPHHHLLHSMLSPYSYLFSCQSLQHLTQWLNHKLADDNRTRECVKIKKGFLVVSKYLYALLASTSMSLRILLVTKCLEILIATSTIWFVYCLRQFSGTQALVCLQQISSSHIAGQAGWLHLSRGRWRFTASSRHWRCLHSDGIADWGAAQCCHS